MAESFLLDTSAFITLTDKEAGFERVQSLLKAGRRGEVVKLQALPPKAEPGTVRKA